MNKNGKFVHACSSKKSKRNLFFGKWRQREEFSEEKMLPKGLFQTVGASGTTDGAMEYNIRKSLSLIPVVSS